MISNDKPLICWSHWGRPQHPWPTLSTRSSSAATALIVLASPTSTTFCSCHFPIAPATRWQDQGPHPGPLDIQLLLPSMQRGGGQVAASTVTKLSFLKSKWTLKSLACGWEARWCPRMVSKQPDPLLLPTQPASLRSLGSIVLSLLVRRVDFGASRTQAWISKSLCCSPKTHSGPLYTRGYWSSALLS